MGQLRSGSARSFGRLVPAIPSLARQPGRYLVGVKELVVTDPVWLVKDLHPTGWGLDQFCWPSAAAGTAAADAIPCLGLAGLVVDRHAVNEQLHACFAFGAAAPGFLFGWPDHPQVGLRGLWLGNSFLLLGAVRTPAGAAVCATRLQCAFLPAAPA